MDTKRRPKEAKQFSQAEVFERATLTGLIFDELLGAAIFGDRAMELASNLAARLSAEGYRR